MARLRVSEVVNAPAQAVFDMVDDHETFAQFFKAGSNLEWTSPRHEVGTRLKMESRSAGITLPMEMETTEVDPPRRLAGNYVSGLKGTWEWLFEPVADATTVTIDTEYELPMGILGQIADRTIVERDLRSALERSLTSLKERVETGAATM